MEYRSWIFIVLSMGAVTTVSAQLPNITWPPLALPDMINAPFLPQLVIKNDDQKLMLLFMDLNIWGLNHTEGACEWGKTFLDPNNGVIRCNNLTVTSRFKSGGKLFDLPIVGQGTVTIKTSFVVFVVKNFLNFDKLELNIEGINPGSDMEPLLNALGNNLKYDLSTAACKLAQKLAKNLIPGIDPSLFIVCDARHTLGAIEEEVQLTDEQMGLKEEQMAMLVQGLGNMYNDWKQELEPLDGFARLKALGEIVQAGLQSFVGSFVNRGIIEEF